jgi:hypothetical protein
MHLIATNFKVFTFETVKEKFYALGDQIKDLATRVSEFFKSKVAPALERQYKRVHNFVSSKKKINVQKPQLKPFSRDAIAYTVIRSNPHITVQDLLEKVDSIEQKVKGLSTTGLGEWGRVVDT